MENIAHAPSRIAWLGEIGRDFRFAARALGRAPLFSVVTLVSLGAGLALAALTLAITDAYLLRGVPFPDGQRLYHVMYAPPGPYEPRGMTALDWSALSDIVAATLSTSGDAYFLGDERSGGLQYARALRVSPEFVPGVGVRPMLGEAFAPEDFKPGRPAVAMIGHALWRERFNSDPKIVGREIRATPEAQTNAPILIRIIGVLPPGFWWGRTSDTRTDLLLPMRTQARTYMIRLRDGVPVSLAERRITEAARAVGSDFRPDWTGVHLESMHERYVSELRPLLLGINAATATVLALVCTNVAILVLLRALKRQKETAVRVALGAGRWQLLRPLLAETSLLCAGALVLAVALTAMALRTLAPVIEARLGRPPPAGSSAITIDPTVVFSIGGIGVLVALALAFIPLLVRRGDLADSLRRSGLGATDGPGLRRLQSTLIMLEIAGALGLLAGGGLMIRSVVNLLRVDLGRNVQQVVRVGVALPASYREPAALAQFWQKLGARLAETNPVFALGSSFPPFYENHKRPLESDTSRGVQTPTGELAVGAGYFAVHGIELRDGREFTLDDRFGAEPVAVVSESLARQLWPGDRAVGHRLRIIEDFSRDAPMGPWRTVVGVARDVRQTYDDRDPRDVFFPFFQSPTRYGSIQMRTDRPGGLSPTRLAGLVNELEPFARVAEPSLLASEDQQFARARFMTALLGGFAGFTTLLALLGIYGVTSYTVLQRQREVAIRMAVGATNHAVIRLFLRQGSFAVGGGIAIGLIAAVNASRILASQVFGVEGLDAVTFVAAGLTMAACGLLAIWWPARRAAKADVMTVLKEE